MDAQSIRIGGRIRERMPSGMSQNELARRANMTPDGLQRAFNGQNGFSMIDLSAISKALGDIDVHWLITGQRDPHRVDVIARHRWDHGTRTHTNPGENADREIVDRVARLYKDAYPTEIPPSQALPTDADSLRALLGSGFVRKFAEVVESELGIDVIRVPGLTTDYSMLIGERGVIVVRSNSNWFHSNWSFAHELGHLALGHHDGFASTSKHQERPANSFAADLLLPAELIADQHWEAMTDVDLVRFLWESGVSTKALANRLDFLNVQVAEHIGDALAESTPKLLHRHSTVLDDEQVTGADLIAARGQEAAQRRFPLGLLAALTVRVEAGEADPENLAWALAVPVDDLDFPEPDEEADALRYEQIIAQRPTEADWEQWLAPTVYPAS